MAKQIAIKPEILNGEKWVPVLGYERDYSISNFGRVKGGAYLLRPQLSIPGYYRVYLSKDSKPKWFLVSRLVALHFIPNPENKPCVNHIDCNPKNNRVENLEWCTLKENTQYAAKLGRMSTPKNYVPESSIPVIDTKTGKSYTSMSKAAKAIGVSCSSLSRALRGEVVNNTPIQYLNAKV